MLQIESLLKQAESIKALEALVGNAPLSFTRSSISVLIFLVPLKPNHAHTDVERHAYILAAPVYAPSQWVYSHVRILVPD